MMQGLHLQRQLLSKEVKPACSAHEPHSILNCRVPYLRSTYLLIIDSSICVAQMTNFPAQLHFVIIIF